MNPAPVMEKDRLLAELSARIGSGAVLRAGEPLAVRTTLRVGGSADVYFEPFSEEQLSCALRFCAEERVPFLILGRGSNLLVRDGGVRGLVIGLGAPEFSRINGQENRLTCGAGARLKDVASRARQMNLTGLEFLDGIPGSLGGALRMNAGAMGSAIFDKVRTLRVMTFSGEAREMAAAEAGAQYRGCPLLKTHIALGAVIEGQPGSGEAIAQTMLSFNRKRWESQPKEPSAGCTFKNPPGVPAGKLIERLGLKGARVGGACVSAVHGNFIVNDRSATARDVLDLIEIVRQKVRAAEGIELETEIEIIGEDFQK